MKRATLTALAAVVCACGCAWLADHKPTEAEKAKAVAIARCVASANENAGGAR